MKYVLWIPPTNPLNTYRLLIFFGKSAAAATAGFSRVPADQKLPFVSSHGHSSGERVLLLDMRVGLGGFKRTAEKTGRLHVHIPYVLGTRSHGT